MFLIINRNAAIFPEEIKGRKIKQCQVPENQINRGKKEKDLTSWCLPTAKNPHQGVREWVMRRRVPMKVVGGFYSGDPWDSVKDRLSRPDLLEEDEGNSEGQVSSESLLHLLFCDFTTFLCIDVRWEFQDLDIPPKPLSSAFLVTHASTDSTFQHWTWLSPLPLLCSVTGPLAVMLKDWTSPRGPSFLPGIIEPSAFSDPWSLPLPCASHTAGAVTCSPSSLPAVLSPWCLFSKQQWAVKTF